jgi:very-short-patch-repair endonuclease
VSRAQLSELRLTAKQIGGAVRAGRLERVLPNVFRLTGAPSTPQQTFAAAVLWAGTNALGSFRSAAELWSIDVPEGARAEVTVWGSAHPRCDDVVVHRVAASPERRVRLGIPVTSPERTIVDLAGVLSSPQLEIAFESARRARLVTVESTSRALAAAGAQGRRGAGRLRVLLAALADEPPAESALEVRVARLLRASDLPKPQRQLEVLANGRRYRLDFAWPEQALAPECDGRAWHDFEHDRRRWSAITAATGYRIVWATWARVRDEPERVLDEIRRRVSRRDGGPGAGRARGGAPTG